MNMVSYCYQLCRNCNGRRRNEIPENRGNK